MVLKKLDFQPESGNVDTFAMVSLGTSGLAYDYQTDWPPVVGGCNLLPGAL